MIRNKKWMFFPFVGIAILLAAGSVVMLLWNAILPQVLGAKPLNYPQGVGLLALCRILFGGIGGRRAGGGGHSRMHGRGATPEERARIKEVWRERCRSWKERGGQD